MGNTFSRRKRVRFRILLLVRLVREGDLQLNSLNRVDLRKRRKRLLKSRFNSCQICLCLMRSIWNSWIINSLKSSWSSRKLSCNNKKSNKISINNRFNKLPKLLLRRAKSQSRVQPRRNAPPPPTKKPANNEPKKSTSTPLTTSTLSKSVLTTQLAPLALVKPLPQNKNKYAVAPAKKLVKVVNPGKATPLCSITSSPLSTDKTKPKTKEWQLRRWLNSNFAWWCRKSNPMRTKKTCS